VGGERGHQEAIRAVMRGCSDPLNYAATHPSNCNCNHTDHLVP
jgi:hypothetical protein